MKRRIFLIKTGTGMALMGAGAFPFRAMAASGERTKLTILHTNDLHGHLGAGSLLPSMVEEIRREEAHVLLFDAGDFVGSGTEEEKRQAVERMNAQGYDAVILGNQEIEWGLETLSQQFKHVNFDVISSNYPLNSMPLGDWRTPFSVLKRGGITVGVFGLGADVNSLEYPALDSESAPGGPIATANAYAAWLREQEQCDLVICLSQLGFQYAGARLSDTVLAEKSRGIDLILGGGTHTFLEAPVVMKNADNQDVAIHHAGCDGLLLGRVDVYVEENKGRQWAASSGVQGAAARLA
ncbi:MAG: metallophosphoesterase [Haliscomenobacter sp.]|nr:metallophosphoesterase [Haliscomenobacter sp.]